MTFLSANTGIIAASGIRHWKLSNLDRSPVFSWETEINFDGSTDIEIFGNILNDVISGKDKEFSIFASIKNANLSNSFRVLSKLGDGSHGESNRQFLFQIVDDRLCFVRYYELDAAPRRGASGSTAIGTSQRLISCEYTGSIDTNDGLDRFRLKVNGLVEPISAFAPSGSLIDTAESGTAQLALGGAYGSNGPAAYLAPGTVYRIYVFDYILSNEDQLKLEGFIAWQNEFQGSILSLDHLYRNEPPKI